MRIAISTLLGALFVTGCIFPSFDDMQNGSRTKRDDDPATETSPAEVTATKLDSTVDASPDASMGEAPVETTADASPDAAVEAPPPGAGKVACGSTDCTVSANVYCCAGYASPSASCRNDDSFDDVFGCANGIAHALYCDEKADCPAGQVCCDTDQGSGSVAKCAASCSGRVLCKEDRDCPTGKKCTGSLDSDVPNKVCQ